MHTANTIDLHTHTVYSDGTLTPAELVELAAATGVATLAVTDHDTVGAIPEALAAASASAPRLTLIPGVELSAGYRRELHILGYFRPDGYGGISDFLERRLLERDGRNRKIIEKLNALGVRVTSAEVEAIAGKRVYGRPHIAAALVKNGYADSIEGAFREYLAGGRKAYVRKADPSPADCARAIAAAGGVAVIAHPVQIGIRLSELAQLAEQLIPCGLGGIEAYYPENTPADTRNFVELAQSLNLLATGGSDFHGEYRKKVRLGSGKDGNLRVPETLPEQLLRALDERAH